MQENNTEQPPSLSQLLRENYLAEARAQQRHSEMSRSDASSSHLKIYGSLKGKAEDSLGHGEPHLPDLSAFLSQEELDKSVNLARQAIGHEAREERAEVKASVKPLLTPPSVPLVSALSTTTSPVHIINPTPAPFTGPSAVTFTQPTTEAMEQQAANVAFASDRKMLKAPTRQDNATRNNREPRERVPDLNKPARNVPYGPETQSKKEFLNKAADFIEELSSLFKANSSKRVRPRACKAHRTRTQNKNQDDETVHSLGSDSSSSRERTILPVEVQEERSSPPTSHHQPEVQLDCGTCQVDLQDCRITEDQQYSTASQEAQEVEEEVENSTLIETPYPTEPACEPPHFIQKLKSREVAEGSKVQLDCIVRGRPTPEVRWFCEGKELENSPDIQIITDGEHHSLIIAEAFEEDTGRYSCFASNFYGTDSTSAEIYVEGASSSDSDADQRAEHVAQLQKKSQKSAPNLSPSSNQSLSVEDFQEEFQSSPPAVANEEPSEELSSSSSSTNPPFQLIHTTTSTPSEPEPCDLSVTPVTEPPQEETPLFLPSPAADAELLITQEAPEPVPAPPSVQQTEPAALNPLLLDPVVSSVLTVQSPVVQPQQPEIQLSNTLQDSIQESNEQTAVMTAPIFTKSLQDIFVSEGQLVVLECRVKGSPSPKVDWYREGKMIEDSPEFRILQKKPRSPAEPEEICTLVIAEVFSEDAGMFTCTAINMIGTVSSSASLRVRGNNRNSNHVRAFNSVTTEFSRIPEPNLSAPEVTVTNNVKPHSSTIRLDPLSSSTLRLDPLNTSTLRLDPLSSSMLRQDYQHTSLLSLEPSNLNSSSISSSSGSGSGSSCMNSYSTSTPNLDPSHLYQDAQNRAPRNCTQVLSNLKVFNSPSSVTETPPEQEVSKPAVGTTNASAKVKVAPNKQNGSPVVVPLPDPPANSCLKTGLKSLSNHRDSRSGARVGLRVHFKLPEEEEEEESDSYTQGDDDASRAAANKEPPPVLAKPKLDPAQLQLLHNQVLMEQQQEADPPTQAQPQPQPQPQPQTQPQPLSQPRPQPQSQPLPQPSFQSTSQPKIQTSNEGPLWSPRVSRETRLQPFPSHITTTAPLQQTPYTAPPFTTAPYISQLSSPPSLNSTFSPPSNTAPAPAFTSAPPSIPQLQTSSLMTSPPPAPQLIGARPPPPLASAATTIQTNTIHASHLNLSPLAISKAAPAPQFSSPPAPKLSTAPADSPLDSQQLNSPTPLLRSTHASLMNLTATSFTFNYTRPREFIAAQTFSPARSPSPTESPVPLLHELAAELNSSAASSPTLPPFSPPPRIFPTRVLQSPTSPPSLVSSPTPGSQFPNNIFAVRAQSPPQASSPTSSSSTPSPIQNPVAFLSSVLPSLTPSQPTNSMGLPKGAPSGFQKKAPKGRFQSAEDIKGNKEFLMQEIENKLRLKDNTSQFAHQQKLNNEGKTASRPLGPNIAATVINYDEEYKVSNFEQRLMSEIEFRLERTPVEESDDEVQHEDVPSGKCIAPIFDKKLKNYKAMEGVPVTFSCKILGIPPPKVYWFKDGKQILRRNLHYKKIREGDGTCSLHIEVTTSDDDGNYTVMAANPQGRISCSGHLIIQTGPPRNRLTPIHPLRVRARIQDVEGEPTQERFFQPHFLQAPGDSLAHEGKLCRLDCKVSGLPNPELMWLVNGRPIYPDLYHRLLVRENGVHSLVIDPVKKSDGGTYTCIASNKAGQSSFSLDLKVVAKEMKHPPEFVEKLQNMGIPERTPVRLECRVVGMPPPVIFWKKDNDSIPKTKDRFSMTQDATGYVCLLIQPTTKDDAGWYTVSAKNEAGIVSSTCRLDIYAQWHQSIPAPMKTTQRTGSRYAALTVQGLDIKSAFPTSETSPILFSSSPPEAMLESEEL